jgi:uncharacterized membrane protein YagU involved in acid resistance
MLSALLRPQGVLMNSLICSGLAGFLATAPMTLVIFGGRTLGLLRTPPPVQITANVQRRLTNIEDAPEHIPEPAFQASWLLSHFGYGAGCGVLYSSLRPLLPHPLALRGPAYGLVVWGVSYINLMPNLRLYPPVQEDRLSRTAVMIAAHVVYGVALSVLEQRLVRQNSHARQQRILAGEGGAAIRREVARK